MSRSLHFRRQLDHSLAQLTVPQGYTLSIGGSLALATYAYGPPTALHAAEYVVGALAAFVLLVAFAARPHEEPGPPPALHGIARYNITPLAIIGLNGLIVHLVTAATVGFFVAGVLAAGGYALLVSLFETYVEH